MIVIVFLIKLVTDKIACVMTIGMMMIIKVIMIMMMIIKDIMIMMMIIKVIMIMMMIIKVIMIMMIIIKVIVILLLLLISELVPVGMTWIRGGGQSRAILLLAARFKHHCRHYDYHHHCRKYCRTLIS